MGHKVEEAKAKSQEFHTKEKGVYSEASRDIFRTLVGGGVSMDKCGSIMAAVLERAGYKVVGGSGSRRTVSRTIYEADVTTNLQLGSEIANTSRFTLSGDGTTHKNIVYDSRLINMTVPLYAGDSTQERKQSRSMGVVAAKDHTSKTQFDGYNEKFEECIQMYNESPLSIRQKKSLKLAALYAKLIGYSSDHAKDQKLLSQMLEDFKHSLFTEELGTHAMSTMSQGDWQETMTKLEASRIKKAGSKRKWDSLPVEEKSKIEAETLQEMVVDLGEQAYLDLPEEERREAELYVWSGCGMHKDKLAMEGGEKEMKLVWSTAPPVLLANSIIIQ